MTLHTTSDARQLGRCLPVLESGHALLLLGTAVNWHPDLPAPSEIDAIVYALKDDLDLTGLEPPAGTQVIDYAGWLQLTETHLNHAHWR